MSDGRPLDITTSFAGQTAAAPAAAAGALAPRPVQLAAGVAAASWWGPKALAVVSLSGELAVASLPGAANALGDAPLTFAPGSIAAVAGGSGGGGVAELRGAVVLEPLLPGWSRDGGAAGGSGGEASGGGARQAAAKALGGVAGWLAGRLGVSADVAAAAGTGGGGAGGAAPEALGWRLALLAERTPAQMVGVLLRERDWGGALQLCKAARLHPDVVYRARWAAEPVSKDNIQVTAGAGQGGRFEEWDLRSV
jgi:hypothetical protein